MEYRLKIDPAQCIGCRSCELACALANDGKMDADRSRIAIVCLLETDGASGQLPYNLPNVCRQCADAPCREVCPENAIIDHRGRGILLVNKDICTGCGKCVIACPFGAIHLDVDLGKAVKCELCGNSPACEKICPSGAIRFEPKDPFYARLPAFEMATYRRLQRRRKPKKVSPT